CSPPSIMTTMPLQELATSLHNCQRCKLAKMGRTKVVFGVGNPHASVMFVGEAPGFNEDQQGEPFVGAGKTLKRVTAVRKLITRRHLHCQRDQVPSSEQS